MKQLRIGFLCSHGGSNMQAIIDNVSSNRLDAKLCAMISNNSNAFALERAQNANLPHYVVNEKTHPDNVDKEIIHIFKKHGVNIVLLAGYMKIVSKELIESFNKQVLNIHPALLPKFGGLGMYGINVHKAVIAAKELKSGATIHLVDAEYDKGRILAQSFVEVSPTDTAETLSDKVLKIEHILYSETLINIVNEEILLI